ncbi:MULTISPECIES: DUF5405 family protein [Yersinia]|nr:MULTISPECIES: DUF5405 family protein [Yersinia]ATM86731.1 hypothetical protein CRN74_11945 [Yersinia frederiksenii]CFR14645.1 putative relication initiation protein [Yersinia frederiksenii]
MRIEIENYVITSDEYQFTLSSKNVFGNDSKHAGQTYEKTVGYYPKLSQLITALIMRSVMKSEIDSLQAMQQHINRVSLACEKALKDFTSEPVNDEVA